MTRPYISWPIERLETLFDSEGANPGVLDRLQKELAFRGTKRASLLLERVNREAADSETEARTDKALGGGQTVFEWDEEPDPPSTLFDGPFEVFSGEEANFSESQEPRQPPDDRNRPSGFSLIRPIGTAGLPTPWNRQLNEDLTLEVDGEKESTSLFYSCAIRHLIAEIKSTGSGQKRYELEKGVRVAGTFGDNIYQFAFVDEAGLFEDAKVEVELPGRCIEASIVSISLGSLLLSTQEDLGAILHRAVIVVDATALLAALQEKLEQVARGELRLKSEFADAVVGRGPFPRDPSPISKATTGVSLDGAQRVAVETALKGAITYIWGPPGCGKTYVLGEIVRSAFDEGKRILICSNTNKAVDQVLWKICENLTEDHPAMSDGKIVRLGQVSLASLKAKYEAFVTVEGIVARKAAALESLLKESREKLERIDVDSAQARQILARFESLDAATSSVDALREAEARSLDAVRKMAELRIAARAKVAELGVELSKPRTGFLGWFRRSAEAVGRDLLLASKRQNELSSEHERLRENSQIIVKKLEASASLRDGIKAGLSGLSRAAAEQSVALAASERESLIEQLRVLEGQISDIRSAVLREAQVLGATCTKTYLSAKDIGQVDLVIVDEASMVFLPMVWFAA